MKDVALRASVSLGTVSKYLNAPHRVAPATQQRIRDAVDALGYTRNEAARQLKSGRSRVLAFVALELNNPFFGEVAEGMERRAAEDDLYLSIVSTSGSAERETDYIRMLVQQRVYGVILASGTTRPEAFDILRTAGMPTVLMDAYAVSARFSSCSINDYSGARKATEHLIAQGCRRIAFVGGENHTYQIAERLRGASAAIEGVEGVALEVVPTVDRSVHAGLRVGRELAARPSYERPDGIFAANDSLAIGAIGALTRDRRISIPRDIAVVGYDDVDFVAASAVPLTSVRRPREVFGRRAVDLIRDQVDAGSPGGAIEHVLIEPELIVRESSIRCV
ncbi:LacI family DNA-binding transcriptional regulator [Microbacterium sp. W4I20]|uniref:LacI family DNA-binding transcriptional regulator n=1 Tax=Microbacterium sp. W4I20 TaxID=3042262 RepID=UPI0027D894A8|nr:LacI family DNA-binding transcriptional regulator [Microbacterium sp. W4I20]